MSEDEKRGLTYEQFQKAKPLIYAEGVREGCEELMLEAGKMDETIERLREERQRLRDQVAELYHSEEDANRIAEQATERAMEAEAEVERLRELQDMLRRLLAERTGEVARLRADNVRLQDDLTTRTMERNNLQKAMDVHEVQVWKREVERLREAFLRHEDGSWTFVETYDGRWIRVADDFARDALTQEEE